MTSPVAARRCLAVLILPLALLFAAFSPVSVQAKWLRAESPLFVVYSDGDEAGLRKFTQDLQDFDALLRSATGLTGEHSPNKLTVYLVTRQSELQHIYPKLGNSIYGFYDATPNGVFLAAVRSEIFGDWAPAKDTLFHEYTHHFVSQYDRTIYPQWCNEGLAEYYATAEIKDDRVNLGSFMKARVWEIQTQAWIPIGTLFTSRSNHERTPAYYSEAWLTIHYFMETPERRKQLAAYLQGMQHGEDSATALKAATGMDTDALDKVLRDYLAKGKVVVHAIPRPAEMKPVEITVAALPPSADKLILSHARLVAREMSSKDTGVIRDIREAAAAFPNDALALRTVGMAEALYGDGGRADAALDKVLAANPNDVEALQLKEKRYYRAGLHDPAQRADDWAKARSMAGRIYKLDPNNYPALYLYALMNLADGKAPSENTLNTMLLAHQLAPHVAQLSLNTALALVHAGRVPEAKAILGMMAGMPHAGLGTEAARALMARIDAGDPLTGEVINDDEDADARK